MIGSWVDKYRPETWSEIQGNNKSIKEIKEWGRSWSTGDPPQLMVGEPGTGKTTTAYVTADMMGWELNQINASSLRTKDDIKRIVEEMQSSTIDGGKQLVLLDEVDSWHSSTNTRPLVDALDTPRNPVMLTANDAYDVPNGIKKKCKRHGRNNYLKFKLSSASRRSKLNDIVEMEGLNISDTHIEALAERQDLRSAINDLQLYNNSNRLPGNDEREMDMSEWEAVDNILRGKKEIGFNISPPNFLPWLDENVSNRYRGLEAAMAYRCLAFSDKWVGVSRRSQNYHWWKYAGELQEQVANQRLSEPYDGYIDKDFPEWFRMKSSHANDGSSTSSLYHTLKDTENGRFEFAGDFIWFRETILPILKRINDEDKYKLAMENRLDKDEMEVLGISKSEFEDWKENSRESTTNFNQSNALDW